MYIVCDLSSSLIVQRNDSLIHSVMLIAICNNKRSWSFSTFILLLPSVTTVMEKQAVTRLSPLHQPPNCISDILPSGNIDRILLVIRNN